MAGNTSATVDLQESIRSKSEQVHRFLAKARPRRRRLLNATLIGGGLSALLTAGPALGGKTFTDWLSASFGLEAPAWRLLCAAAAMASFVATLATQFLRSHGVEENLAKAQVAAAKLEILLLGLVSGRMDEKHVLTEYIRTVESLAFLHGEA
jgi:MFS family permease